MATMKNEALFYIPDTQELLDAKLTPEEIERMVLDLASDSKVRTAWSYGITPVESAESTAVMGSYQMAQSAGLTLDDAFDVPTWTKTIWRRYCFRSAS